MLAHLPHGKINRDFDEFPELEKAIRSRLGVISDIPQNGLLSKFKRHVALSKLNVVLSFYGWATKYDGTMFEVSVCGEPKSHTLVNEDPPRFGSLEELNERARNYYSGSGVLRDPRDG